MKMTVGNGQHELVADYPLQTGVAAAGLKPMELLLASLATCAGSVVALLLDRMKQPVARLEVDVRGSRRDEHPTVFTEISLEFAIHGAGVDPSAVEKAIAQADEKLCPVWAMLKPGTSITTSYRTSEG
ncbi:MAG TPA: OsmC family protein [Myxococcota bacterium]|nr:OsmC family protein [Myxococcota bacterium]HRY97279.1 OsmC family protein [Myxococcota bacterium]